MPGRNSVVLLDWINGIEITHVGDPGGKSGHSTSSCSAVSQSLPGSHEMANCALSGLPPSGLAGQGSVERGQVAGGLRTTGRVSERVFILLCRMDDPV